MIVFSMTHRSTPVKVYSRQPIADVVLWVEIFFGQGQVLHVILTDILCHVTETTHWVCLTEQVSLIRLDSSMFFPNLNESVVK